jgi:hypothetical protein
VLTRSVLPKTLCGALGLAVGAVTALVAIPGSAVLAQSAEDCIEVVEVATGTDSNGNPTYRIDYVNVCEQGGGGGNGNRGPHICVHDTYGEFPCSDPVRGWWSSSLQCYVSPLSPQPPAGDERWEGNDPADGALYGIYCPEGFGAFDFRVEFMDEAPGVPSIAALAQQAMESLPLVGPNIGIAPNPEGTGLVGVPVWLWTENTDATWGPLPASVSVAGITVTAQGQASQIAWNMGDGTTVVCENPGRPYDPSYGAETPDCGHVYSYPSHSQPDGRYQVTATTTWHVEWWVEPRGSGATGEDFFERESTPVFIQIHELQVVTS